MGHEDVVFTYNAIRLMMSRYLSRDSYGRIVETPGMLMKRVAMGLGSGVDNEAVLRLLLERKFMFNSPVFFNLYVDGAKGTLSACYVTPIYDDMYAIMEGAVVQAMTFKYGGGQGFSFSNLRPRWAIVKGTGSYSSGPVSFMRIFDIVTESVKQGGKRRGANMGIMHVWHPDIYNPDFDPLGAYIYMLPPHIRSMAKEALGANNVKENPPEEAGFIQAKEGMLGDVFLTNFNISVGINDAFMEAVVEDREWWMVNPAYSGSTTGEGDYRIHYTVSRATGLGGLGKLLEKHGDTLLDNQFLNIFEDTLEKTLEAAIRDAEKAGFTVQRKNPYAWRTRAREIWRKIVENAWKSGDPGVIYFDNHNKWNPTPWLGALSATNPCSEQVLYPWESCNLGSISVDKYVDENGVFMLEEFYRDVQVIVDAMDTVIDINRHPDPRHHEANRLTRKIGIGIMGLADALVKAGYPYDSDDGVAFTLILMAALEAYTWKRSWERGALLGHAPAFECRKYDWVNLRCIEKGEPEELVQLHYPALRKASDVLVIEDGWVKVKYHHINAKNYPLEGEAASRLEPDGAVRLVKLETLEKVLGVNFGVTRRHLEEAFRMKPEEVVNSPRHLLALAIYKPLLAWQVLVEYGRSMGAKAPRNTVTTTVAPTGSISILAGTSSGVEPYFALVFTRHVSIGKFDDYVRLFRDKLIEIARRHGLNDDAINAIIDKVKTSKGSLRRALPAIEEKLSTLIPTVSYNKNSYRMVYDEVVKELQEMAKLFPTALDVSTWYHLAHQAVAQVYVDQSISKTINLPNTASVEDVEAVYMLAWLLGLKGVTVYRDESKAMQVISFGGNSGESEGRGVKTLRSERNTRRKVLLAIPKVGNAAVEVGEGENSTCKSCNL
jgi:ribonucleoside-diphosphate reductase alpha chain